MASKLIKEIEEIFIIAEAGDQHFGSVKLAKEMALKAKLCNASAIKFQHHLPDEEMLKEIPDSSNMIEPLYDFLVKNALSIDEHTEVSEYCNEIGIEYMCTPFSYKAAVELIGQTNIKRFKIGSGEMTDIPSLIKIANLGLPMIVSTGMSTYDEIDETYNALIDIVNDLSLLYCVSEYPPIYNDMNLLNIQTMQFRYSKARIGHSDHTPDLYTAFAAAALGAKIIEKHVILDKKMPGPDQSVSIDFNDLQALVDGVRKIELALGSEKKVHDEEKQIREWAFRSVVSIKDIKENEIITKDMVWTKRPGTGIPSKEIDKVIGKKAIKAINKNSLISWEQLEI
jgi:N,N'-diacetyllegionaminate synthase